MQFGSSQSQIAAVKVDDADYQAIVDQMFIENTRHGGTACDDGMGIFFLQGIKNLLVLLVIRLTEYQYQSLWGIYIGQRFVPTCCMGEKSKCDLHWWSFPAAWLATLYCFHYAKLPKIIS